MTCVTRRRLRSLGALYLVDRDAADLAAFEQAAFHPEAPEGPRRPRDVVDP